MDDLEKLGSDNQNLETIRDLLAFLKKFTTSKSVFTCRTLQAGSSDQGIRPIQCSVSSISGSIR